jgi:hypothetical protein
VAVPELEGEHTRVTGLGINPTLVKEFKRVEKCSRGSSLSKTQTATRLRFWSTRGTTSRAPINA